MMGSGVRTPAVGFIGGLNVLISSRADLSDTRAAKITETRRKASEIANWHMIGTREASRD
jgi:hypothetical protein